MSTTVNFTYQFLKQRLFVFSSSSSTTTSSRA